MTDPEYQYDVILPHHLATLREVAEGRREYRNGIPALLRRGLIDTHLHSVEINPLGRTLLAGVHAGAMVMISEKHRLPMLRKRTATVDNVFVHEDGSVVVDLRIDGLMGTWCFYESREERNGRNRAISDGMLIPFFRTSYGAKSPTGLHHGTYGPGKTTSAGYDRKEG